MKEVIQTDDAPKPRGPLSQAIKSSAFVFVSGQTPRDPATGEIVQGDIATQTERVLKNVEAVLKAAGSDLSKVIKATVYLTDIKDRDEMNRVYGQFFKDKPPARTAVEVSHLSRDVRIEIDVIALA